MKKIEAIIRKTKFEDVKEALLQSDINWFEYHDVHGIGQSRQERIYRGVMYSTDVIERVAITIVCRDQFLDPTVKVILDVAHTGEVGDGRIFVSDVLETYSIRTGEKGDTVLRDKKKTFLVSFPVLFDPHRLRRSCASFEEFLRIVFHIIRMIKANDARGFIYSNYFKANNYERNWNFTRYRMDAIGSHVSFLDAARFCAL